MQDNKPIVGVIACTRTMDGEPVQRVFQRYLDGVSRHAGALPVILPNNQPAEAAAALVSRLDAVLLTGSTTNIEPSRYGRTSAGQAPFDPTRDNFAIALIHAAVAAGKPLFGICRGLQEINVAFGGTLLDMRGAPERAQTHHAPAEAGHEETFMHTHLVNLTPDNPLRGFGGSAMRSVNSVHYQTIHTLGEGLVSQAIAPDGAIEAIAARGTSAPVFAVQWHPEWRTEQRPDDVWFWRYLGEAAAQYRR